MALLARIFVVLFALLAACGVAALVLTLGLLPPEFDEILPMPGAHAGFGLAVAFSTVLVSGYALIPAMLFVAVAEGFRLRSFLVYATFGALFALVLANRSNFWIDDTPGHALAGHEQEVFAAAGIAAGLAYWALAGRRAGAWRGRRAQRPRAEAPVR